MSIHHQILLYLLMPAARFGTVDSAKNALTSGFLMLIEFVFQLMINAELIKMEFVPLAMQDMILPMEIVSILLPTLPHQLTEDANFGMLLTADVRNVLQDG